MVKGVFLYPRDMTVDISESRDRLVRFLENNRVGVLATANRSGKPHAAAVYVTFDQDLNMYFVTRKGTRKSHNLQDNGQVAIAIYNASAQTTLQAEGTAVEVTDPQKARWVFNDIWQIATQASPDNPPPQAQLVGGGDYVAYKLSAPSLRLAMYAQQSSARSEDIFATVPTQGSEHFNAYGGGV